MHDLIIIGSGPAGLTAGLYAGRFRLNTILLEKMVPGGQIILSTTIENFPGFPGGISTGELIERFRKQVEDVGVRIESQEVIEVSSSLNLKVPIYHVKTKEASFDTRSIIIATGAQPKRLGVEGEMRLTGRGVSYCGTCDGPFFKEKEIVVVGGGDRAIEDALFLTNYAKKVTVIHRRQQLRASKILAEKAYSNPKINFILDAVVEEILGSTKVEAVRIRDVKTNTLKEIPVSGIFIFVGIIPNTEFIKNQLHCDELGFIITDHNMKASLDGVFACGDCTRKGLYQVVNACGEAAVAADSAHKYLLELP